MKQPIVKTGLKILVAFGLLSWFLFTNDLNKIIANLASMPVKTLAAATGLCLIYHLIKSYRWWMLLPQYSFLKLLELNFISQFYSLFSAGQVVGEGAKIYIMGKGQSQAGEIAVSILIDKITGIIGLIIVSIVGIIFAQAILPLSLIWTFIISAVLCLAAIFLIRVEFVYNVLEKILNNWQTVTIKFKRVVGWAMRLLKAWHNYSHKTRIIFLSIVLSVIFQLVLIGIYMILSSGVGIHVSFLDWCWLSGVLAGFLILPITIGGIGVREGSLIGLLGLFAVEPERALALSFSFFGVQLVIALIGGLIEAKRANVLKLTYKT